MRQLKWIYNEFRACRFTIIQYISYGEEWQKALRITCQLLAGCLYGLNEVAMLVVHFFCKEIGYPEKLLELIPMFRDIGIEYCRTGIIFVISEISKFTQTTEEYVSSLVPYFVLLACLGFVCRCVL